MLQDQAHLTAKSKVLVLLGAIGAVRLGTAAKLLRLVQESGMLCQARHP